MLRGDGHPDTEPRPAGARGGPPDGCLCRRAGLLTERSLAFLKNNAERPFFLEVSFNAPHWPFQVPGTPSDRRSKENYGPERGTRGDYVKMVEALDGGVGRLLDELDRHGLSKD